jgi:hypothetical protein
MKHQLSDNQTWVLALLGIVYAPMVARKVGRLPLDAIISGPPPAERVKLRLGLQALADLNIVVIDRGELCITNISESLLHGLDNLTLGTVEEVAESLRESPKFALLLRKIDEDSRLSPP